MAQTCDFSRTKDSIKAWYKTNKIIDDYNNILNLGKFRTKVSEHSQEIVDNYNLPLERIYKEESNGTKAVINYSYLAKVDAAKKKIKAGQNAALLKAQQQQFRNVQDVTVSSAEDARIDEELQNYLNDEIIGTSNKILQPNGGNTFNKFNPLRSESGRESSEVDGYLGRNGSISSRSINSYDSWKHGEEKEIEQISTLLKRAKTTPFNEIWRKSEYTESEKSILLLQSIKQRLSDATSFNGKLLEKIVKDEKRPLDISFDYEKLAGSTKHKLHLNIENLVDFIERNTMNPSDYIDMVLAEELIHLVSFKVAPKEELLKIYKEQTVKTVINSVNDFYESNFQINNIDDYTPAALEFIRAAVQKEFFGKTTEDIKYEFNDRAKTILSKIWEYIKDLFTKPETKRVIQKHIDYIKNNERNNENLQLNSTSTLQEQITNIPLNYEQFVFGEKISKKISKIQSFDTSHIKRHSSFELDSVINTEKRTNQVAWDNSGEKQMGASFSAANKLEFLDKDYFQISNKQERTKRDTILASFYHLSEISSDPNRVFKRIENSIKSEASNGKLGFDGLYLKVFGGDNIATTQNKEIVFNLEKLFDSYKHLPTNEFFDRTERVLFEEYIHLLTSQLITEEEEKTIFGEMTSKEKNNVVKLYGQPLDNRQIVHEYLRMIIQHKTDLEITELGRNTIYAVFKRLLNQILKAFDKKPVSFVTKQKVQDVLNIIKRGESLGVITADTAPFVDTSIQLKRFLQNLPRNEHFKEGAKKLAQRVNKEMVKYSTVNLEGVFQALIESEKFIQDMKTTPGRFPYQNLHKEFSTEILKLAGYIPHTKLFNDAMVSIFGYENKPLKQNEYIQQSLLLSRDKDGVEAFETIREIIRNEEILQSQSVTDLIKFNLTAKEHTDFRDITGYVGPISALRTKVIDRTISDLWDSGELTGVEWRSLLYYFDRIYVKASRNIFGLTELQQRRAEDNPFSIFGTHVSEYEKARDGFQWEFIASHQDSLRLNFTGRPDPLLSSNSPLFSGTIKDGNTLSDSLQKKISGRTFNELFAGSELNDLERADTLLHVIKERLSTKNTFNGRLHQKLRKEYPSYDIDLISDQKGVFFVDELTMYIDIEKASKQLFEFEGNKSRLLDLILAEELIHVVTNATTENRRVASLVVGLLAVPNFSKNISDVYRSFKNYPDLYNNATGLEYIRMGVQDKFFAQTTESHNYKLQDFFEDLKKALEYLRDLFVASKHKREIDEHIDFITKALKEMDQEVDFETLMEYNTTPDIWEISNNVEQYNSFKKNTTYSSKEDLVEKYKEHIKLEGRNEIDIPCL